MIKVGVIRGGIGSKYEESLYFGENILRHLRLNEKYKVIDILIDKNGLWYIKGLPVDFEKIFYSVDLVFITIFENKVKQILNHWNIPSISSSPLTSAICEHKILIKEKLHHLGVKIPKHIVFPVYQKDFDGSKKFYPILKAREVWDKLSPPFIVKPLNNNSPMAIHICYTFSELILAFEDGMNNESSVIVEQFIEGKKASVSVVKNFRKKSLYSFPVIGNFSQEEKKELERISTLIHSSFNIDYCSQSNFIVNPKGIYALSVKTFPDFNMDFLETTGSNMTEFLDHLISEVKLS